MFSKNPASPQTMMGTETQQDAGRRTFSPTIRRPQRSSQRAITRPSQPFTSFQHSCGFVDELYEFPDPPSPSTVGPMFYFTESEGSRKKNLSSGHRSGDCSTFQEKFHDLPSPIRSRLVEACESAMRELVAEVEKEMKETSAEMTLPEDVCIWRDVVAAAEVIGLDVEELKQLLDLHDVSRAVFELALMEV